MDVGQFKAWFEGFTEGMEGPPTAKQWERIRAKVKEITHVAATYPVFVDRYWRPAWPQQWPYYHTTAQAGSVTNAVSATQTPPMTWDSRQAFAEAGRMEARDLDRSAF
jgi:hypothetical protein